MMVRSLIGSTTINSHTDISPMVTAATWKQRRLLIGYFTAVSVAMLGWLAALSWAGASLASWLFS